jgi:hypothetical protein
MTVKGTTLLNFDVEKSQQYTIRKPETLKKLIGSGKRVISAFIKALTTKPAPVNGRLGDDTIIMVAIK